MKENEFIRQNKKRWNDFESELKGNSFNPERVSNHYIKIIDDLSYARTHYKNRLVRSYLNGVSQILSLRIYKSQKGSAKGIQKFWKTDLPLVMYHAQWELLISFSVFLLAVIVGVISGLNDPDFLRFIISDDYVEMTLENIAKGDPMAVYKDDAVGQMFFGITINNILVSAYVFSLGIVLGIGTIIALVYNGVMLGAFQQFFFSHDVGIESMLTIWQHGTIEISAIILAGAAGLTLSKGMLFPGTFSRLDAFRISGRKGLMMILGLMPLLVYSGFIEAVVTRMTDIHWSIRLAAILGSLFFVLFYFLWYPRRVAKNKKIEDELIINLQPVAKTEFHKNSILGNTVIVSYTGSLMSLFRTKLASIGLLISGVIASIITWNEKIIAFGTEDHWPEYFLSRDVLVTEGNIWLFGFNFITGLGCYFSVYLLLIKHKQEGSRNSKQMKIPFSGWIVIIICGLVSAFLLTDFWLGLALLIWIPISALIIRIQLDEDISNKNPIAHLLNLYRFGWVKQSILSFTVLFLSTLAFYILEQTLVPKFYEAAYAFLPSNHLPIEYISIFVSTLIVFIIFYVLLTFSVLSNSLSYDSLKEQTTAESLLGKLEDAFPTDGSGTKKKKQLLNRVKIHST